jgi:hypothetical protein
VLAGVPFALGLLVLVLAVVQHAANGRGAVGIHLDEVETGLAGDAQGFFKGNDAIVLGVVAYEANLFGAYPVVNPKLSGYPCSPRNIA